MKKVVKESLYEKFKEESDPIKDMGIGMDYKAIAKRFMRKTGGNLRIIAKQYFSDSRHTHSIYKEGNAMVLYQFFRNIQFGATPQEAFENACEDENYYGMREDIAEDREEIADVIKKEFNIEIDPHRAWG